MTHFRYQSDNSMKLNAISVNIFSVPLCYCLFTPKFYMSLLHLFAFDSLMVKLAVHLLSNLSGREKHIQMRRLISFDLPFPLMSHK